MLQPTQTLRERDPLPLTAHDVGSATIGERAPLSPAPRALRTPAHVTGGRRPTCVVYTVDMELAQARLDQIYRPAILAARRALMAADGDLAIIDLAAGGEPDLEELRAVSANFAGLVIVYEVTRAPLKIIRAFSDAEKVGFDALDPQWRQGLTRHVREALEAVVTRRTRRERARSASGEPDERTDMADLFLDNPPVAAFAGAFLGCLTTLDLTALGLVPSIASALATVLLCCHLLVTRTKNLFAGAFFPALYGGTFGGMTPVLWLSAGASGHSPLLTGTLFVALSLVCGLTFFVVTRLDTRSVWPLGAGYGGRSGAIAAAASVLFVQAVGLLGVDAGRFHSIAPAAFGVEPWAFLSCVAGISATLLVLRHRRVTSARLADTIFAASTVALIGLEALQICHPDDPRMLEAFYAGCFLGMSAPERISGWFQPVLGAVVLTAVLAQVHALLPGIGGSLGPAAFVSVALLVAVSRVMATGWATATGQWATLPDDRLLLAAGPAVLARFKRAASSLISISSRPGRSRRICKRSLGGPHSR